MKRKEEEDYFESEEFLDYIETLSKETGQSFDNIKEEVKRILNGDIQELMRFVQYYQ